MSDCLENRLERFCHSGFNRLARVFDVPPGTPPAVRHPLCVPLPANTGSGLHLASAMALATIPVLRRNPLMVQANGGLRFANPPPRAADDSGADRAGWRNQAGATSEAREVGLIEPDCGHGTSCRDIHYLLRNFRRLRCRIIGDLRSAEPTSSRAQAITMSNISAAGLSASPWHSGPCWCSGIFISEAAVRQRASSTLAAGTAGTI
jgi:hypothetical protein